MTLEAVDSGSLRSGRSETSRPTQGWFRHNRSSIVRHLVINLFLVIILVSRGGMGGGDMKLGAMLGAFLGWKALLFALFAAIVLGGVVGVAVLVAGLRGRKDPIPFGPFLAAGGAMALLWGERIIDWWLTGFSL
jgi:leader peptidase (prepilin peptidase)/N-methyltransferase